MFSKVWAKYLPVIRVVIKRSLTSEQIVLLNASDFEKAGLSKKSGNKFFLKFREGTITNIIEDTPVISSLATALQHDKAMKEIFAANEFHISLNAKFELTIKHIQHFGTAKKASAKAAAAQV